MTLGAEKINVIGKMAVSFWPWNSTVHTNTDSYTGFIPSQPITNNSGCCYSL